MTSTTGYKDTAVNHIPSQTQARMYTGGHMSAVSAAIATPREPLRLEARAVGRSQVTSRHFTGISYCHGKPKICFVISACQYPGKVLPSYDDMKVLKHSVGRQCTNRVPKPAPHITIRQCEISRMRRSAALLLAGDCALNVHRKSGLIDPLRRLDCST